MVVTATGVRPSILKRGRIVGILVVPTSGPTTKPMRPQEEGQRRKREPTPTTKVGQILATGIGRVMAPTPTIVAPIVEGLVDAVPVTVLGHDLVLDPGPVPAPDQALAQDPDRPGPGRRGIIYEALVNTVATTAICAVKPTVSAVFVTDLRVSAA